MKRFGTTTLLVVAVLMMVFASAVFAGDPLEVSAGPAWSQNHDLDTGYQVTVKDPIKDIGNETKLKLVYSHIDGLDWNKTVKFRIRETEVASTNSGYKGKIKFAYAAKADVLGVGVDKKSGRWTYGAMLGAARTVEDASLTIQSRNFKKSWDASDTSTRFAWAVGANYDLGHDWSVGASYTDTGIKETTVLSGFVQIAR